MLHIHLICDSFAISISCYLFNHVFTAPLHSEEEGKSLQVAMSYMFLNHFSYALRVCKPSRKCICLLDMLRAGHLFATAIGVFVGPHVHVVVDICFHVC